MFGNPETTTGWNALKFYASQRLDIRKKEKIESGSWDDKEATWNRVKVKVVKNKIAPPFKEAEMDVLFNEWISKIGEILDIWVDKDLIKKSGAFYSYGEVKLWQWRENSKQFLRDNQKIAAELEKKIRVK